MAKGLLLVKSGQYRFANQGSAQEATACVQKLKRVGFGIKKAYRVMDKPHAPRNRLEETKILVEVGAQSLYRASGESGGSRPLESMSSNELYDALSSSGHPLDYRITALREVASQNLPPNRPSSRFQGFLVAEVSKTDVEPRWLAAIVSLCELVDFTQREARAQLKPALLQAARRLSAGPGVDQRSSWCAVRRFASLADRTEVDSLVALLNDVTRLDMKVACLQAVVSIFLQRPAAEFEAHGMKAVVRDLAHLVSNPQWPCDTTEQRELLVEVASATACLRPGTVVEFARLLKQKSLKPWILSIVSDRLNEMAESWSQVDPASSAAVRDAVAEL